MSLAEIGIFVGIAAAVILTQIGRRQATIQRFLIPLGAVGFVAYSYLHTYDGQHRLYTWLARIVTNVCLSQLSAVQREVIDLVYYHEKSVADVARIVGVPRNTVKTRTFHARRRIGMLLKAAGHADICRWLDRKSIARARHRQCGENDSKQR